jgi:hypothetical protein
VNRRIKLTLACWSVALMLLSGAAYSQTATPSDSQTLTDRLLQRIADLEAAQKAMQQKLDGLNAPQPAPVPAPAVAAPAPVIVPEEPAVVDTSESHALGPIQFRGYGTYTYGRPWFENQPAGGLHGSTNSFSLGDFDLFVNSRISDHWSVLGEMLVTSDFTNAFSVEMDRFLLSYKRSDRFSISFGKFNTALGYYPNEFHRAVYFQTDTGRPIMYTDEDAGGILPVHSVGVTATGAVPSGKFGLHWVAEVANGRSATNAETPVQNFVDQNNSKAFNLAFYARPEFLSGFQTGFSFYHDTEHPAGVSGVNEDIFTGHAVYVASKLEFLNEASLVRHSLDGRNFDNVTGYTQVSYRFGAIRPFVRFDYLNTSILDPVFSPVSGVVGRQDGPSIGINRHLSNYVVLKLMYGRLSQRGTTPANDFQAQLAFAF